MTVKIDRFKILDDFRASDIVSIVDYAKYEEIISFATEDKRLNMKLAEICLEQLNEEYKDTETDYTNQYIKRRV